MMRAYVAALLLVDTKEKKIASPVERRAVGLLHRRTKLCLGSMDRRGVLRKLMLWPSMALGFKGRP